jgi:APA family basic amino acid/polyamine antiporter
LHADELKRSIGLFQAVTYGVGLILGAGIYVIIGDVAGIAGNAMWISFILVGLVLGVVRFPVIMSIETSASIAAGTNLGIKHPWCNNFDNSQHLGLSRGKPIAAA